MIDSIISFIHSEYFLVSFAMIFFANAVLGIIVGIWVGRNSNINKMDMIFQGYSMDVGIPFNLLRAASYGTAMLFPNSIGKRMFKNVDISLIDRKAKRPYLLYTWLLLLFIPIGGIGTILQQLGIG